jgi:hypothetical protein
MSSRRFTTFVSLGGATEPPPPPDPVTVVVEYEEWHAADGDAPAVRGAPWSSLALAEASESLVATPPGDRTRLIPVDPPRYAFHARPVASGRSMWLRSGSAAAYDVLGFRFVLDDPPGRGWISGVATFRYDTYQVDDEAVFDAAWQTLEVLEVHRVRYKLVRIPGQGPVVQRAAPFLVERVDATAPVRLDHMHEGATFHVTLRLPG